MHIYAFVIERERQRERVCVRLFVIEREREREREGVCAFVCVIARERQRESVCVRVFELVHVYRPFPSQEARFRRHTCPPPKIKKKEKKD